MWPIVIHINGIQYMVFSLGMISRFIPLFSKKSIAYICQFFFIRLTDDEHLVFFHFSEY